MDQGNLVCSIIHDSVNETGLRFLRNGNRPTSIRRIYASWVSFPRRRDSVGFWYERGGKGESVHISAFREGSGAWPYLVWKTAQKLDKIKGLSSGRSRMCSGAEKQTRRLTGEGDTNSNDCRWQQRRTFPLVGEPSESVIPAVERRRLKGERTRNTESSLRSVFSAPAWLIPSLGGVWEKGRERRRDGSPSNEPAAGPDTTSQDLLF